MIGSVAMREAPEDMFRVQAPNGTNATVVDTEARDAHRVQIAVALTCLVGIIQVGFQYPFCIYQLGSFLKLHHPQFLATNLIRPFINKLFCSTKATQSNYTDTEKKGFGVF